MKMIKKKAKLIFDDAKILLREHKGPEVENAAIDSLCDKTCETLLASLNLFEVLMKPSPSPADIADLRAKVSVYMEHYRKMFTSVPPKAHILEDHAVEQYILHLENGLPLVVEQFVGRNHQDGKRQDE